MQKEWAVMAQQECKMTREQWKNRKAKQPSNHIWFKEGTNDVWKALNCKELAK